MHRRAKQINIGFYQEGLAHMQHEQKDEHPILFSEHILVFYAILLSLGIAMIYSFDLRLGSLFLANTWDDPTTHLKIKGIFSGIPFYPKYPVLNLCLLGGIAGTGMLLCSFGLESFSKTTPINRNFLARTLGCLEPWKAFALIFLSVIAEECFFRAGMQNLIGATWAVVMYSLLHLKLDSKNFIFNVWNLKGLIFGILFAYLYDLTESLIPATLAHFLFSAWTYFYLRGAYLKQGKFAFLGALAHREEVKAK